MGRVCAAHRQGPPPDRVALHSWRHPCSRRQPGGSRSAPSMASIDLEQYKDLDRAIEQLLQCKPLSEAEVRELCAKAQNVFVNENNVQPVAAPVTVRAAAAITRGGRREQPAGSRGQLHWSCRKLQTTPGWRQQGSRYNGWQQCRQRSRPGRGCCRLAGASQPAARAATQKPLSATPRAMLSGEPPCTAGVRRHPRPVPGPSGAV